MRLFRLVDNEGKVCWAKDLGVGQAEVMSGDPLDGLVPTGKVLRTEVRLAPVVPTNIYCIGLNYKKHAAETAAPLPKNPVIFMKPTTSVSNPCYPVKLPKVCREPEVDFEGELAVVIGKEGRDISRNDALKHVLGYTCAADISARRWQKEGGGGQWIRGKSFDTFCPMGPVLATADEVPDPQQLKLITKVNGKIMQESCTGDMIFSVAELISFISQDTTLLPGTVILTGTPSGVGFVRKPPVFLQPGDFVSVTIDRIGELTFPVAAGD